MIPPAEITRLWRAHADGLALLARGYCGSQADDLVQEAFVRLAGQANIPQDPLAWLARAVRNLAIDSVRSATRRRRRERLFSEGHMEVHHDTDKHSDWSASDASQALQVLDAIERDIVIAHLWNVMTFRQIAEAFAIPSSTVHRKYNAALELLKKHLERDGSASDLAEKNQSVATQVQQTQGQQIARETNYE